MIFVKLKVLGSRFVHIHSFKSQRISMSLFVSAKTSKYVKTENVFDDKSSRSWWLLNLFNFRWRRERIFNKTLALEIESEIYNYAKSNLAIINIFIKEPYSKRFRKTEKMSRIAYIASSGGLLGLCMGFSFVSLAEILYHCFICVSIFFKKSSKSTHVMKDLYTSHSHKTSK